MKRGAEAFDLSPSPPSRHHRAAHPSLRQRLRYQSSRALGPQGHRERHRGRPLQRYARGAHVGGRIRVLLQRGRILGHSVRLQQAHLGVRLELRARRCVEQIGGADDAAHIGCKLVYNDVQADASSFSSGP